MAGRTIPECNFRKFERLVPRWREVSYAKLKAPSFMDLSIDFLGVFDGWVRLAISHYFEQNGDLVADPDMVIELDPERGIIEPLSIQHPPPFGYHEVWVFNADGSKRGYRPKLRADMNRFLRTWLTNIEQQGHTLHEIRTRAAECAA